MDSTGIFFEKPRCRNPYVAWALGKQRGFLGFILILGNFLFYKNFLYSYPSGNRLKILWGFDKGQMKLRDQLQCSS